MDKTDFAKGNGSYLMSCTEDAAREELPQGWKESRGQLLERMKKVSIDYGKVKETRNVEHSIPELDLLPLHIPSTILE